MIAISVLLMSIACPVEEREPKYPHIDLTNIKQIHPSELKAPKPKSKRWKFHETNHKDWVGKTVKKTFEDEYGLWIVFKDGYIIVFRTNGEVERGIKLEQ